MLLVDDFKRHKSQVIKEKLTSANTMSSLVPPNYASVIQPCDVGINKPLMERLRHLAKKWRSGKYALLFSEEKLPSPSRTDILGWIKNVWDEFPTQIVENSFSKCDYVFENVVDYSMDTDSK